MLSERALSGCVCVLVMSDIKEVEMSDGRGGFDGNWQADYGCGIWDLGTDDVRFGHPESADGFLSLCCQVFLNVLLLTTLWKYI